MATLSRGNDRRDVNGAGARLSNRHTARSWSQGPARVDVFAALWAEARGFNRTRQGPPLSLEAGAIYNLGSR